jgi:hypothetical protein
MPALSQYQKNLLAVINSDKSIIYSPQPTINTFPTTNNFNESEYFVDDSTKSTQSKQNDKKSCKSTNMKSFLLCFVVIILLYLVISSSSSSNNNNNNNKN